MKLIMVTPYFYPKMGGVEKYVYEIGFRLVKKYNIEVVVICSCWGDDNEYKEELINGIKVYRLPFMFKVSSTPINPFWGKLHLLSIIKRENPDIINGHFPVPYIADITARISRKTNIPFILTYHNDLEGYNPLVRLLSKTYYYIIGFKTFSLSQRIIVTSEYYAKSSPHLRKYYQKLRVVSPGVDIGRYNTIEQTNYLKNKYNLKKDEKIILFVGQLNKESQHKGLAYLIKAIKIVNNFLDVKLVIVGTGNYLKYYQSLVSFEGIREKVIFAGYVDENELPKFYCGSDVVVLPSYNRAEGFGMVLIEAQACGKPVIGTTVGGIPYSVRDGETGLLVPPKDPESLAQAIQQILSDENLAREMGRAGYKRVSRDFTWEKSTEAFLMIIEEALRQ